MESTFCNSKVVNFEDHLERSYVRKKWKFFILPDFIVGDPRLSFLDFKVLCAIASFAGHPIDEKTGTRREDLPKEAYPSTERIKQMVGIKSRSSISRTVTKLTELGYIERVRRGTSTERKGQTNLYIFTPEAAYEAMQSYAPSIDVTSESTSKKEYWENRRNKGKTNTSIDVTSECISTIDVTSGATIDVTPRSTQTYQLTYQVEEKKENQVKERKVSASASVDSDESTLSLFSDQQLKDSEIAEEPPKPKKKKIEVSDERIQKVLDVYRINTGRTAGIRDRKGFLSDSAEKIKYWFEQGYSGEDFIAIIEFKTKQWKDNEKMKGNLHPTTLFRKCHFKTYLAQANDAKENGEDA